MSNVRQWRYFRGGLWCPLWSRYIVTLGLGRGALIRNRQSGNTFGARFAPSALADATNCIRRSLVSEDSPSNAGRKMYRTKLCRCHGGFRASRHVGDGTHFIRASRSSRRLHPPASKKRFLVVRTGFAIPGWVAWKDLKSRKICGTLVVVPEQHEVAAATSVGLGRGAKD